MANKRMDVLMALRAQDQATPTFRQVRNSVQQLTDTITAQAEGVRKGEVALEDLKDTYQELRQVAETLASQKSLIETLRGQTAELDRLGKRAENAKQELNEFGRSLEGKATISEKAQARLNRLNTTVEKTAAAFAKQQADIDRTRGALERLEVDTKDLDAAQKSLLTTEKELAASLRTLDTIQNGYSRTMRAVRAEEKASADAARQKADTIARVNAAMQKQAADQERLVRAVRAAETASMRDAAANAAAVQKETEAYNRQTAEIDRLLASRVRLSNTGLARAQGAGGAERAVQDALSPTIGQRNLAAISTNVSAFSRAVSEGMGRPVANFLGLMQDLERTLKSVQSVARQVDGFQAQRAATQATAAEYLKQRAALRQLNEEARRSNTKEAADRARAAVPVYNQATAAFREQLQRLRELRVEMQQAGVSTRNFGETQRTLVDLTNRTNTAIRNLQRNYDQFGGSAREGAAGFLGMRPYEIQHLSFQINDLFTQIASGTSITQAFAQQAGQIAQIQPVWTRIVRFAPYFVALAAAIGTTTAALIRLYETTASNRQFEADLRLLSGGVSEGLGITAERMTALSRQIEALGFDFNDARKAATGFLREGLAPANLDAAVETAARLSRLLGQDMADATKTLTTALRGGSNAVIALREAGIGLNETQRQAVIDAGALSTEFERQRAVLAVLGPVIRDIDENALSPWTRVVNGAKEAWRGLLDELGKTAVFSAIVSAFDSIVRGLGNMRNVGAVVARSLVGAFAPFLTLLNGIRRALGMVGTAVDQGPPIGPEGRTGAPGASAAAAEGNRAIAESADTLRAIANVRQRELEAIRDDRRRSRADRERANRLLLMGEAATGLTGSLQQEFPNANREALNAQRAIRELEFRRKLDEESERGAASAAAAVRRDFQAIQTDLQNTIRIRDEAIRGIQEDIASGALTPADAIRRIQEEAEKARPAIERLRDEAQRFLDSGRGRDVVRDSALERVIAQANRQLTGQAGSRAGTNTALQAGRTQIESIVQQRQAIVQENEALVNQRVITQAEGERRIQAAYNDTNDTLRQQIEAYREAGRVARETGAITESAWQLINAQADRYEANLKRIDPAQARLIQGIENVFGQAAGAFFDSFAQAMGNFIAGVTTLEEAFEAAGEAALKFFADVLKGIAQVILQEQILQAVRLVTKAISGGIAHDGAVIGSPGGMKRTGINPAIFAVAPRMHNGGIVGGLRRDERAAILQTGEEVLARDDPRNILNRGQQPPGDAGGGSAKTIRNVLVVGDNQIAAAMSGEDGDEVILNFLQRNAPAVRSIVRG